MTNEIIRTEKLQHNKSGRIRLLVMQNWNGKIIVGFSGYAFNEYNTESQALLNFNAYINDTHNWTVVN